MAAEGKMTAVSLLFFATFTQGLHGVNLYHMAWVNATVGQNISLPCSLEEKHDDNVAQIEWKKSVGRQEIKIVVFNPQYTPHKFWENISLHLDYSGEKLRGSVLQLQNVSTSDSGKYVCELTTYPHGSLKTVTNLQVTEVQLFAGVVLPNRHLREGDEVTIFCNSTPPADSYSLWPSKKKAPIFNSTAGRFVLRKVTRHDSDLYICQPRSSSSGLSFHGWNATVQVTVNYLDELKCNTNSSIEAAAGQNVTISCATNSSQSSKYTWRKGNVTVSTSESLHLQSMSSEQAGVYTLTVVVESNADLRREAEFNVTVWSGSRDLMPSVTSSASTTNTLWGADVTMTMGGATLRSTSSPPQFTPTASGPTSSGSMRLSQGPNEDKALSTTVLNTLSTTDSGQRLEVNSTATAYASRPLNATLTLFEGNSTGSQVEGNASRPGSPTVVQHYTVITPTTANSVNSSIVNDKPHSHPERGNRYMVLVLLPVLVLLFVIAVLYRRHVIQRRMDLPPPFKPPPPPVKYTSVRTQDVPLTDILRR